MDCGSGKGVARVLGQVLCKLVDMNKHVSCGVTKFQSSYLPNVTIEAYIERIHKFARCSESCFIIALIYIDRIVELKNFVISSLNVHRVAVTAILLASKYHDDFFYNNAYYAKLGGIAIVEMNSLELAFLRTIEFSLYVSPDLFSTYYMELRNFDAVLLVNPFRNEVNPSSDAFNWLHTSYPSQTLIPNQQSGLSLSFDGNQLNMSKHNELSTSNAYPVLSDSNKLPNILAKDGLFNHDLDAYYTDICRAITPALIQISHTV